MFERFTDRARKVMALANQEAQRFNHEYIGTEHILLGLLREGSGVGVNVLKSLNVDLGQARREVERLVKAGQDTVSRGKLPLTPRTKKVIEYPIEEARGLGHNYVGTEHLLLGLLREYDGVAAQVLMNLGLELDAMRQEVLNLLGVDTDNTHEIEHFADSRPEHQVEPKIGETIWIGEAIEVTVIAIDGDKVRLSIRTPPGCLVHPRPKDDRQ